MIIPRKEAGRPNKQEAVCDWVATMISLLACEFSKEWDLGRQQFSILFVNIVIIVWYDMYSVLNILTCFEDVWFLSL